MAFKLGKKTCCRWMWKQHLVYVFFPEEHRCAENILMKGTASKPKNALSCTSPNVNTRCVSLAKSITWGYSLRQVCSNAVRAVLCHIAPGFRFQNSVGFNLCIWAKKPSDRAMDCCLKSKKFMFSKRGWSLLLASEKNVSKYKSKPIPCLSLLTECRGF